MKKFVIGLGVFGLFIIYSLGIRHGNSISLKLPAANSNQPGPSSQSSSSGTATSSSPSTASTTFKDGTYTGSVEDAFYGNVQVAVTVSSGKITDVKFLQYPNSHSTSVMINQQAMPLLRQEAIQAQSANVQIISGATFTAQAFQQSLRHALSQA